MIEFYRFRRNDLSGSFKSTLTVTEKPNSLILSSPIFADALERMKLRWNVEPEIAVIAPGRVNLIGEHVDYNGGNVLPAAIDKHLLVLASPRTDGVVRLTAKGFTDAIEFKLDDLAVGDEGWERYVKGVLAGMTEAGVETTGFDAYVDSTIPIGGGLSSSAALEAAFALLCLELAGKTMDRMALAKICQMAERDFAGVPCGIMDQAAVLNCERDHLLLLNCEFETSALTPFDFPDWTVMIIDSRVTHALVDGEYAKRRQGCDKAADILGLKFLGHLPIEKLAGALEHALIDEELGRYVRHVVTEVDRTQKAVQALKRGSIDTFGTLLNGSHLSLRADFQVSCKELDFIAATAQELDGVAGCRMTGGGFGGSCVALVRKDSADAVEKAMMTRFMAAFDYEPNIFTTSLAQGATLYNLNS
jgi:galactokinase|tara:strand:+ start:35150 stop:36403 length:1254 start_codon:yes stop_codon:yes gene_type:complete